MEEIQKEIDNLILPAKLEESTINEYLGNITTILQTHKEKDDQAMKQKKKRVEKNREMNVRSILVEKLVNTKPPKTPEELHHMWQKIQKILKKQNSAYIKGVLEGTEMITVPEGVKIAVKKFWEKIFADTTLPTDRLLIGQLADVVYI
jgi:hypothetical protein